MSKLPKIKFPPRRQVFTFLAVAVLLTAAILATYFFQWTTQQTNTNTTSVVHESYGLLYQSAWRADEERGNATMTATLFVPRLRQLLIADTQRSSTDEQIATILQNVAGADIPVVVTLDALASSTAATMTDEAVRNAVALSAPDINFSLASFTPLNSPSKVATNTSTAITNRLWLVIFQSTDTVDWTTVRDIKLTVNNIEGVASRVFTWARPSIITDE